VSILAATEGDDMGTMAIIEQKIRTTLAPVALELTDDSGGHKGHAGYKENTLTHVAVDIVSAQFEGKSRVARHRLVYDCLKEFLDQDLHAVTRVMALTPAEYEARKAPAS
jgi:BolA protein